MLKYLLIQLDNTSTSFCYYDNSCASSSLIPIDMLKQAILWAMKENLSVQVVYPRQKLTQEYEDIIDMIDHYKIVPYNSEDQNTLDRADVIIIDSWAEISNISLNPTKAYVLRTDKNQFFRRYKDLSAIISKVAKINIIFTDIQSFTENDFNTYKEILDYFVTELTSLYLDGHIVQLNVVTDRMLLSKFNNCGAGDETITIAPDGCFYPCPAFYYNNIAADKDAQKEYFGSLNDGMSILNPQLYKITHAPICQVCDAFQCKRCVWLNRRFTNEINTPGREQCVLSHLERNAARKLLMSIRKEATFIPSVDIKEIDYLDPFDIVRQ